MSSPQMILDNIRMFMRLQSMDIPSNQLDSTAGVEDLIDALSIIDQTFQSTSVFNHNQMYQVSQYNYLEDIKDEMEEWLLVGEDVRETALKRRKNLTMYHLVIEPIIDCFETIDHDTAVNSVGRIVEHYIKWIKDFDDFGDATDGIVANFQIKSMVSEREHRRKQQKILLKQLSRKKVKPMDDVIC